MDPRALVDPIYRLRYGVSGEEKSRLAVTGAVPGARPVTSQDDADREERRASAFLFGRKWPTIGPVMTSAISDVRRWTGEDPQLGEIARDAAGLGAMGMRMAGEPAAPPSAREQADALMAYRRTQPTSPTPMPAPPPPPYRR